MTFKEHYEKQKAVPTAAGVWIRRIAILTHKSENTVRMWLSGRQTPDALTQAVLEKHLKTDCKNLFPNAK